MQTWRGRRRSAGALAIGSIGVVLLPSAAWAHVTVQPSEVEGGGYSVVSFRVPNERDDASTAKVQVLLPVAQPVASVSTTPVPGWEVATKSRTLDDPIELHGEQVDTVVSQVTWTATAGGVEPGQFQDFDVSMGPLPESGEMVFTAIQTYDSGEVVKWNEVAVDDAVEPERPAPVLTISAPVEEAAGTEASDTTDVGTEPASATTEGDDEESMVLPLALSGTALVVAVAALLLAVRRRA